MTAYRRTRFYLLLITLLYFALPFVHIGFALTGLLCMAFPFLLLFRDNKKSWCREYCPRSHFFDLFTRKRYRRRPPAALGNPQVKSAVLSYFCLNLLFIVSSTIMVASGNLAPIDRVRILILFEIPVVVPQVLSAPALSPALLHLSFRIYSLMTTSLIAGTLLALLYRPRTWCRVCPVNSLSDRILTAGRDQHAAPLPPDGN